jgi:hypothetical protein
MVMTVATLTPILLRQVWVWTELEYYLRSAGLRMEIVLICTDSWSSEKCVMLLLCVLCDSFFLFAQFSALYIGKLLLHKILNLFLDCLC